MGHLPIDGPDGSLAQLPSLGVRRTIFVHMNNTNPILLEDSPGAAHRGGQRHGGGHGRSRGPGVGVTTTMTGTTGTTETAGTTGTGADGFVEALRAHSRRYHDQHPFHVRMNAGRLSRRQIQGWVANRFYYQENIPRKDAAILANCPDLEVRRRWIRRIVDHDGTAAGEGGIEAWLRLGEAAGLTREEVRDHRHLVPGVRFAVDAYVNFARTRPWVEAVASSLTELFAPDLMAERLAAFERWYPLDRPRGPRLLPRPPRAGSPRLRARPGGGHRALPVRRLPGARDRRAVVQVRRPVEPDGRHRPGLPGVTAMDPTTTGTRSRPGVEVAASDRPRLARHVRLTFSRTRQRYVLQHPETVVVLNGSGADILELCDGRRTVAEIVAELGARYRPSPTTRCGSS